MVDNAIQGFTNPITLYYRASIVCGCSICKGWKKHRMRDVEVQYYYMVELPNIEGALPPTI